jgi:hypothetical protein
MTTGLTRARALKRDGTRNYKKLKKAAEASVATWLWAAKHLHAVSPAFFECSGLKRGRQLPGKPEKLHFHVHEGFDARGRLVVTREYVSQDARGEGRIRAANDVTGRDQDRAHEAHGREARDESRGREDQPEKTTQPADRDAPMMTPKANRLT